MTLLQDATQFITAKRDAAQCNVIHHHLRAAAPDLGNHAGMRDDSIEDRNGFDNVLTVLGNAACDATERDAREQRDV